MTQMQRQPQTALDFLAGHFAPPSDATPGGGYWHQVAGLVPNGVNAVEVASNWFGYVNERMQDPKEGHKWRNLSVDSLRMTLMQCASLGMYPGPQAHVYIVPYGNVATLIVGYKGLVSLLKRSGKVVAVDAECVYESDTFSFQKGTVETLHYVPNLDRSVNERIRAAYAKAAYANGHTQFHVMTAGEIERVRKLGGPTWKKWPDRMARKSAIRQLFNLVGMDSAMAKAAELVDREAMGQIEPERIEAPPEPAGKPQAPAFALGFQGGPEQAQHEDEPAHSHA